MILCNRCDPKDEGQLGVRNLCCVQHRVLSLQDPLDCDHIRPGHLLWVACLWIDFHGKDVVDERVLCDLGPGGMSYRVGCPARMGIMPVGLRIVPCLRAWRGFSAVVVTRPYLHGAVAGLP